MQRTGLGPGIIGRLEILPYAKLFRGGAYFHDIGYSRGTTEQDKIRVDKMFYRLMKAMCNNNLQKFFACLYYYLVKKFGWMYFNYK